jgi:two-component system sensor histidine kinase BaeS
MESPKPVLLDFWAAWCGPCRMVSPIVDEIAVENPGVKVGKINVDEQRELAAAFNIMALNLEKNEKTRRQWVADTSHELRTPLAILRGEIEAMLEGIRETTPDAIRSLHGEVLRLHRLVDDLYQLALCDLGSLTYHREAVDVTEVLDEVLEPFLPQFAEKGITATTIIPDGMGEAVFADRQRLGQLFSNLLDNSLKYTDNGGEVVIRAVFPGDGVMVELEDSPPGVPEEHLERLFDRLYRLEGSRSRASGGAGLGLAICRSIAEAHGGTISAHPSALGGLRMRVSLPAGGMRP